MIRSSIPTLIVLALAASFASAQIPYQAGWKYRSGQNVVPAFEGWEKNPDGSFDMIFAYFNRNYEETLDIPVGPNNFIEPGNQDQGQPTFFLPARRRFFFSVRVPKDWPASRKLTWTLTIRGKTVPVVIPVALTHQPDGTYRAVGKYAFKQSSFGIQPVRVAGGTIKVKDEVETEFEIFLK